MRHFSLFQCLPFPLHWNHTKTAYKVQSHTVYPFLFINDIILKVMQKVRVEFFIPSISVINILFIITILIMGKKLFVGNISWDATEEMLKDLFATIGETEEVALIKDRNYPDRHKGFAFVTMVTEELAQEAIEKLNEADLAGRAITVSEARPKTEY